ncbi:type VI secretion system transmembrane protein TssO [Myroides fluvii]|uniref:type VI secretion system transmembrane protein TssO n=1 Tax=Myroides fluvii TaxID=2572594 RepID=UPI00131CDD0A|nr:type VI secretion system transmembrane protein TssO [Myroides fluvii]
MTHAHQSLSRKEQIYQLFYLIGMLALALVLLGIIGLSGYHSPFAKETRLDAEMLEQKNRFNEQQKKVEPLVVAAFQKINTLALTSPKPIEENEIVNGINQVVNSFANTTIFDPRKEVYNQIGDFYKMYLEDKKIIAKKQENIKLFRKQFEECSIGFKDKEQQLIQRRNRLLTR